MPNKKILIISGAVAVIIIAAVLFYFFYFRGNGAALVADNFGGGKNAPAADSGSLAQPDNAGGENNSGATVIQSEIGRNKEFGEKDLKFMAASFAERFGSYSNHSGYKNISDLKIFMSEKMKAWADNYVAEAKTKAVGNAYYGIITRAVTEDIKEFDDNAGRASVMVGARRQELSASLADQAGFNQNILIKFAKEDGIWKIDAAEWQ